jgi:hypothetical protein
MKISSNFDSGNIKVIEATDPLNIQLETPVEHNATNVGDLEIRVTEIEYKV